MSSSGESETSDLRHVPVMLKQVEHAFFMSKELYVAHNADSSGIFRPPSFPPQSRYFLDMTFGYGGHSEAILRSTPQSIVYAIDRDSEVVERAAYISAAYNNRLKFFQTKFSNIRLIANQENFPQFDGILFDLGASTMQLEGRTRGFSFTYDSRLNMCMGLNHKNMNAEYVVNNFSKSELSEMIFLYGEERYAEKISNAISLYRQHKRITHTHQLASIIVQCVGKYYVGAKIHPATKTFQALRIVVNDELSEIYSGICWALTALEKGGILVVISFHSLEDGIVKEIFKKVTQRKKHDKYAHLNTCCYRPHYNQQIDQIPVSSCDKQDKYDTGQCCHAVREDPSTTDSSFNNYILNASNTSSKIINPYLVADIWKTITAYSCNMVYENVTPGVIVADRDEIAQNRRSRSAKMRILKRIK